MSEAQDTAPAEPPTRRKPGRPATGTLPVRAAGRHGKIWDDCVQQAAADGQTMTDFVAAAIARELRIRRSRSVSRVAAATVASRDTGTTESQTIAIAGNAEHMRQAAAYLERQEREGPRCTCAQASDTGHPPECPRGDWARGNRGPS